MDALTKLYREIARPLIGYAMSFTGEIHSAEDIVSEAFVRAAEHLLVRRELPVRAWFYKVARNLALDALKRKGRLEYNEIPDLIDDSPETDPEASLIQEEEMRELRSRIAGLPEVFRSVLLLREFSEFSYAEISGIMNINESNVKVLLFRARKRLRELYTEGEVL